jgi:hypothetical protein
MANFTIASVLSPPFSLKPLIQEKINEKNSGAWYSLWSVLVVAEQRQLIWIGGSIKEINIAVFLFCLGKTLKLYSDANLVILREKKSWNQHPRIAKSLDADNSFIRSLMKFYNELLILDPALHIFSQVRIFRFGCWI